jgi:phosphoenolpyruvate phosphomutase / 2-hydroxyethylphosphonate cytidylyltransferase
MKIKKKIVYVPLAIDFINEAHIRIIDTAKKYGEVIIGLLTDKAIAKYKSIPLINYETRELIVKNLKNVSKVIPDNSYDYIENLIRLKPDYLVHGDDWKKQKFRKHVRPRVIKILKKWKGVLIEPKSMENVLFTESDKKIKDIFDNTNNRVSKLNRLIKSKEIVRVLESHNSLTGLIIENLKIEKNKKIEEFDCMWSSSLTDSATKGKPDNQSVDYSSRISSLNDILDVTSKPLIFDADNGGQFEHLSFLVRSLERNGVSAIIMEDKVGLKKNSLFADQKNAKQDSPKAFAKKIKRACTTRKSKDFLIIARIESFILGKGLKDALKRAEIYSKAGADAILIHSKEKTPEEIFSFSKIFNKSKFSIPLVAVPSTYSRVYEKDLVKNGFKVVIYANHLLRAAYPAMEHAAKKILENKRSFEIEKNIIPIKKIINLIGDG